MVLGDGRVGLLEGSDAERQVSELCLVKTPITCLVARRDRDGGGLRRFYGRESMPPLKQDAEVG